MFSLSHHSSVNKQSFSVVAPQESIGEIGRMRARTCAPESASPRTYKKLHVDGREISKVVVKNMVKMGQGPATGARLPDYYGTRPLSI